ncbi:hypothetical protein MRB53_030047 [Persea americana]|uniref:Uncharacterized protein n=1 Tax=Persea americana TaxID=3435 RepID=A0ACC2KK89_PERAE|nr:hypothetical protein MRB53_030047 [Persea americana]
MELLNGSSAETTASSSIGTWRGKHQLHRRVHEEENPELLGFPALSFSEDSELRSAQCLRCRVWRQTKVGSCLASHIFKHFKSSNRTIGFFLLIQRPRSSHVTVPHSMVSSPFLTCSSL